jgi:hypothetical protein
MIRVPESGTGLADMAGQGQRLHPVRGDGATRHLAVTVFAASSIAQFGYHG